jgi:hypothetical protein
MTREEEIRARCEAATPGPWYNGDGSVDRFFAGKNTVATPERVIVERATYNDEFDRQTYADIGFITHAREDIPYLLDENARLQRELDALKADIEAGRLVRFYTAEETPPTEDVDTYLVIVEHIRTKVRRAEFTEFRFGEWDISNIWNLLAWTEYPDLGFAAMKEDAHG